MQQGAIKAFDCHWADRAGHRGHSIIEAMDKGAAYKQLMQQDVIILSVKEATSPFFQAVRQRIGRQLTGNQIGGKSQFYQQGSVLIQAGLPLWDIMELLGADELHQQLARGVSLGEAMRTRPDRYSSEEIALVEAGEYSGNLAEVFSRLAEDFATREQLHNRLQLALLYPTFLLVISGLALLFIVLFVLPVIMTIFTDLGLNLPWSTRLLLSIGRISGESWLMGLAVVTALGLAACTAYQQPQLGALMDRWLLQLPCVGSLWLMKDMGMFLGILAMLLNGGIVIDQAVKNSAQSCGNRYLTEQLLEVGKHVSRGTSFYKCMTAVNIPPLVQRLIEAGEQAGELPAMLNQGSRYCRLVTEHRLSLLQTAAEPVLILVLGIAIGFIVLSIVLPMLDIMTAYL